MGLSSIGKELAERVFGFIFFCLGRAPFQFVGVLEIGTEIGGLLVKDLLVDRFPAIPVGARAVKNASLADVKVFSARRAFRGPENLQFVVQTGFARITDTHKKNNINKR
jgi:hypothetical protein